MTHRKAKASAANAGGRGKIDENFVSIDDRIVPQIAKTVNVSRHYKIKKHRRPSASAVNFALNLAAPIDEPSEAGGKRFRFLFYMREQLPPWLWLSAKEAANIRRNGLADLSPDESRRFVNIFGGAL